MRSPGGTPSSVAEAVDRTTMFPRLRYMGSKYRLIPQLATVFDEIGGRRALDAFSGSGVVSYLLKSPDYEVTANDFLNFPAIVASAAVANQSATLTADEVDLICTAEHKYSFGTHSTARRRDVAEYLFIGR